MTWTYTSEFRRLRQKGHEFKVMLTYLAKLPQEINEGGIKREVQ